MTSVLEAAKESARDAGATKLLKVSLSVGEMTEAIEDALVFAFEALTENDPFTEGAELSITMVKPKSHCFECDAVYEHDRFHMLCPECGNFATELDCRPRAANRLDRSRHPGCLSASGTCRRRAAEHFRTYRRFSLFLPGRCSKLAKKQA